jgi:homoserine kinase
VSESVAVRVPASSANLGAGFDVLALALDEWLFLGVGPPPRGALAVDDHHPAARAFVAAGGGGGARASTVEPIWLRSAIPMGRGLGFSGAARVAGAALAVTVGAARTGGDALAELESRRREVLDIAAVLEGHGDNVAASTFGGVVAWVGGRALPMRLGPRLRAATVVAWVPDTTTSTDRSRSQLSSQVERCDVVHNLGRVAQFVLAVEHDDPALLVGATDDRLHQPARLPGVPGAADALEVGVRSGAWCGWLSGSGPTVALLCDAVAASAVAAALPGSGHTKMLRIADTGVQLC